MGVRSFVIKANCLPTIPNGHSFPHRGKKQPGKDLVTTLKYFAAVSITAFVASAAAAGFALFIASQFTG